MIQKLTYAEAKKLMIKSINHDATAHEKGNYEQIGVGYDELDGGLPRGAGAEFNKLFIALTFWDSWIDARNHEWQYYPNIQESDWPNLAKEIVKALAEDEEITEPTVLSHFDLANDQTNLQANEERSWPRRIGYGFLWALGFYFVTNFLIGTIIGFFAGFSVGSARVAIWRQAC